MDNVESGIVLEKTSGELMKRFAEYCENGRYQVVNIAVTLNRTGSREREEETWNDSN